MDCKYALFGRHIVAFRAPRKSNHTSKYTCSSLIVTKPYSDSSTHVGSRHNFVPSAPQWPVYNKLQQPYGFASGPISQTNAGGFTNQPHVSTWAMTSYNNSLINSITNSSLSATPSPLLVQVAVASKNPSALASPLTAALYTSANANAVRRLSPRWFSTSPRDQPSTTAAQPQTDTPPPKSSESPTEDTAPAKPGHVRFLEVLLVAIITAALVRALFTLAPQPTAPSPGEQPTHTLPGPGHDDAPNYRGSGLTKRAYYEANPAELYRDLPAPALGAAVRALRARGCQVTVAQQTVREALVSRESGIREAKQALQRLLAEEGERTRRQLVLAQTELSSRLARALLAHRTAPTAETRLALEVASQAVGAALDTRADAEAQERRTQLHDALVASGLPAAPSTPAREELQAALHLALALRRRVAAAVLNEPLPADDDLPAGAVGSRLSRGWLSWLWGDGVRDDRQRVDVRVEGDQDPNSPLNALLIAVDADIDRMYAQLAQSK